MKKTTPLNELETLITAKVFTKSILEKFADQKMTDVNFHAIFDQASFWDGEKDFDNFLTTFERHCPSAPLD